jgi:perosamine synthetase
MAFIAPAGTPIPFTQLLGGLLDGLDSRSVDALHGQLTRWSSSAQCWSMSSGRAAMVVVLRAMARAAGPGRKRVVIPGYTCYSVPAAVELAGLEPVLCDIDPDTLGIDVDRLAQMDLSDVAAIVTANLYGLPNRLEEVEDIARRAGAFLLDDAAQSLGAQYAGRPVGGFGDVGLYSFDKGKNVPTMQGGAIVARPGPVAAMIDAEIARLPQAGRGDTLINVAKLLPYVLMLRPGLYGMVRSLPFLGLGQTRYETAYPITRYSPVLAGLASRLVKDIDGINAIRIRNATNVRRAIERAPGVRCIEPLPKARPVYLRLPVRAHSASARDALIDRLERAGIGATASYPRALVDVPEVARRLVNAHDAMHGAREVANTIVTLPTHAYCPADLPQRIASVIQESPRLHD